MFQEIGLGPFPAQTWPGSFVCILTDRLLRAQEGPVEIIKINIKQVVVDLFLANVYAARMPNAELHGPRSRQTCKTKRKVVVFDIFA